VRCKVKLKENRPSGHRAKNVAVTRERTQCTMGGETLNLPKYKKGENNGEPIQLGGEGNETYKAVKKRKEPPELFKENAARGPA